MKRIIIYTALMLLIGFATCCCGGTTAEFVEKTQSGVVNWSQRFIEARGTGAPPLGVANTPEGKERAKANAMRAAYQNLLNTVMSLRLKGGQSVGDYVTGNDQILSQIEGLLTSARVENIWYQSDGTVAVARRLPLGGALSQLILPESIVQLEVKKMGRTVSGTAENNGYSGLVVDARGVSVKPAMCFKIIDEGGQEVYGSAYVSREFAVQRGMCGYVADISAVSGNARVGATPLVVKAINTMPPGSSDIVITNTDASRLRGAVDHLFFLRECRVVVVTQSSGSPGNGADQTN